MKKYLIIIGVLAFAACNNSKVRDTANSENDVRQRTIDSMAAVNSAANHTHVNSSQHGATGNSSSPADNSPASENQSTEPAKKKGMSNTTKGALIGTGVGIATGAATGAATSEDKGKGVVVGGIVGGAVGSGVGYGIGAKKDRDKKNAGK